MLSTSRLLAAAAAIVLSLTLAGAAQATASLAIEQIHTGPASATTTPAPSWVGGDADGSNSHYLESHSIAYRAVMTGLPRNGKVIELVIGYDVKRGGAYAVDYLTHFQRLMPHVAFAHTQPEVFDPLAGVTGVGTVVTTAPIPLPTQNVSIDPDGSGTASAALQPVSSAAALPGGERVMTLYGGTLLGVSYDTEGDVNPATSSSETRVRVRFTASSATAVLAWGGHLANRWEWGFNPDGTPRSAGGISGSSYHMRLISWTLGSVAGQERSLAADAVIPVPACGIANVGPFCGNSTNTHTGPASMQGYAWSLFNNTSNATIVGSSTGQSVVVNAGAGGSYGLLLVTTENGYTKQCQATVVVNPLPTANAGPDQTVCSASPQVQLAGTVSNGTGTWSGGGGTFAPNASTANAVYTPTATEVAAGSVTLTLTSAAAGGTCSPATDQVTIAFQRAATANAGTDISVCASNPRAQLAGTVGGGASSGTWSGGAGTFTPSASALNATYDPTPAEIAAGGVTLTLTTTATGGPCAVASDDVRIAISPVATADAGVDRNVCISSPAVQLGGVVGGAASSGMWSGGAGTFAPGATALNATYTPTAAELAAGGVTLTLTRNDPAGPCGSASDAMRITYSPVPTANAGVDMQVCSSSPSAQLAGQVGGGAVSGTWSGGSGTFNPNASALNATYTPSPAEIAAGSVTLTLTTDASGPCGQVSDQMTIGILPAATANAGADVTVCSSAPAVQLAGVVGGGATSGTWSGGTGTFAPSASALEATYTPTAAELAAGGVTLTLTTNDPDGPCGAVSHAMHITYSPAATANAGADVQVCSLSPSVQLAGQVGGSATGGTWSGGSGTFNPNASALNATYTPSAAEIAAGSVTLTLTTDATNGPCGQVSDAMTISILPAATADAGADRKICTSAPAVQLEGVVGGSATSGMWSGGAGTFDPGVSALNATYTPTAAELAAGGVTLTLTTNDPDGPCGAAKATVHITYSSTVTANAGADVQVCSSSPSVQLAGQVGGSAVGGTWSGGAGTFSPSASALNATYTPSADEIAVGWVALTLTTDVTSGSCGQASDQVMISILPAPRVDAGVDRTVCASAPAVQLAGVVGGAATSGTWSGGAGTFSPSASALNATYTPTAVELAAGGATLTLTTNDPAGPCGAVNDTMRITYLPTATANAGADVQVCSSSPSVQLAGQVGGGATSGKWSGGAGTFNPNASALNATYTPSAAEIAAGSVTLTLTTDATSESCGQASDPMTIRILPAARVEAGADRNVCSAAPAVQLAGAVGGGATSGTWSGGAGTFEPSATALNATYAPTAAELAAGGVTLTLTTNDPDGPCEAVSHAMRITYSPAATANAGADVQVCSSAPSVQLAGQVGGSATGGTWTGGAGTFNPSASTLNATYTPTAAEIAAGSVTLTLTTDAVSGPCGQASDPMTISILPAATVDAGVDRNVCDAAPAVQLAGVVGGGATSGTWSGGAGTFEPGATALNATYTPTPAELAAGGVTLTLTTNDPDGPCEAVSHAMRITYSPAATANAGADVQVCSSSPSVQLAGQVGGSAMGGTWTGGAGTFNPNASALNATYTPSAAEIAAGSVTLTLTSDAVSGPCGQASDPMTISILPAATVDAGADRNVCSASPAVQLAGVVGGGATSGTWSGGEGTFAPSATALNATYTPTAAELAAGGVTLTLTTNDPDGPCGAVSHAMHITYSPAATANAGADVQVCSLSPSVQLAGQVGGGATGGTWSGGAGTFNPSASALNATYMPSPAEIAAGSVTLTLTTNAVSGPCGQVSDQVTIGILPAAKVDAGADRTACPAAPAVQLAGVVGGGATGGTWTGGAGTFNPSVSTLNATYTPSAAELAAGAVTLTLTTNDPPGPCGAASATMHITYASTVTANAGADVTVCSSSPSVQLAGQVGGASGGTWSGGAGTFSPSASVLNPTYTPSAGEIAAGSVTLTLTTNAVSGPCGQASDAMTISIRAAATVNAGPDQAVCSSSPSAQLAGVIGGGASSASWSGGAGTYAPNASTLNATYMPSAAEIAAGGVTLTLTTNDPDGPCGARSDAMRITVSSATVVDAGADVAVCASDPRAQLRGSVSGGTTGGTWSGGAGIFSPNASNLNAIYVPTAAEMAAGSVALTLTSAATGGSCPPASDRMLVFIDPPTTVDAGPDQTVCANTPVVSLNGSVGGRATGGTWTGGAGGVFSPSPSDLHATYAPSPADVATGLVTLTLTTNDPPGPCGAASDQVVIRLDSPAVTVADRVVCSGVSPVTLCASVSSGIPPYNYLWSNGATGSCVAVPDTGSYSVSVTDANGCQASGSGHVGYRDCVGQLAHTTTTCGTFAAGTADNLADADIHWATQNEIVNTITPDAFSYFSRVVAPRSSFTVVLRQLRSDTRYPFYDVQSGQVTVYDQDCGIVASGATTTPGQAAVDVHATRPNQVFIVCVKYSLKSLVGTYIDSTMGCHYDFQTLVDGQVVDADPEGMQIGLPQLTAGGGSQGTNGGGTGSGDAGDGILVGGPNGTGGSSGTGPRGTSGVGLGGGADSSSSTALGRSGSGAEPGGTHPAALERPTPNPFSTGMHMAYAVVEDGQGVEIAVYDLAGRKMKTLVSGVQPAGRHEAAWDGRDESGGHVRRGMYFIHIRVGQRAHQVRVTFVN